MRRRAIGLGWVCAVVCVSLAAGCGDSGETATASSATVSAAATSGAVDRSTMPTPTVAPPTGTPEPQPGSMSWPTEPVTEELGFTSGEFELVGDLVLPGGEGPYPAVIAVAGSGGQTRTSTPGYSQLRDKAVEAGGMNEDDAHSLRDALMLINRIRLAYQAEQMARGEAPGNFVPIEELSPLMRRNLKAAFMLVVEAQNGLQVRYQVH